MQNFVFLMIIQKKIADFNKTIENYFVLLYNTLSKTKEKNMLEFLKNYWELLLCGVLIIVVIVLLIVFRDKPAESDKISDNKSKAESKDETKVDEIKEQPEKEEKVEEKPESEQKVEEKPAETEKVESENETEVVEEKSEPVEEKEPKKVKAKKKAKQPKKEVLEQPKTEVETPEEKAEEVENVSKEEKAKLQKYMVTYDKEQKVWVVKKTGAKRASKLCKTKKEAMEVVTKLADSQDLNISVKKKDGKFQKRENTSK